tara:strand:+ start:1660 stop:2274 length:615 start_codon:yes stop_codon:yes gene_type:complete
MFNSRDYWDNRYVRGGNSGAGSYNNLAAFKAEIINSFIISRNVNSLIDYGVGDGNQLKLIDTENRTYTGIDVSPFIVEKCREIFKDDKTKKFILCDNIDNNLEADLVLSCDVIYHLIEDHVYEEYMTNLFKMSRKYVVIYARNENYNHCSHVLFRKFSDWVGDNLPKWSLISHIPNRFPQLSIGANNSATSPSDFYIYEKSVIT